MQVGHESYFQVFRKVSRTLAVGRRQDAVVPVAALEAPAGPAAPCKHAWQHGYEEADARAPIQEVQRANRSAIHIVAAHRAERPLSPLCRGQHRVPS